jgi:alanyl-tRNA synthetase
LQKTGVLPTDDSAKYAPQQVGVSSHVKALFTAQGFADSVMTDMDTIGVVLERSPFYAESGGQSADKGILSVQAAGGETVLLEVLDVQSYAGYLLHTCTPISESTSTQLLVGAAAEAKVNPSVRRRVAPNHTMTHVLNYALREVLGEGVDQKGSSVNEDRLRFDFSSNRGLTTEELVRIEEIVNAVIGRELEVDTAVVALKDAMSVYGLRAVFGEVYPDPVRVVSVGQRVSDLLSTPNNEAWRQFSIEFCGGTHLSNTRDAQAFTIVEETAVAKGIRRITAVTAEPALEAILNEKVMRANVDALELRVSSAGGEDISEVDGEVTAQRASVEAMALSQACKSSMRVQLEAMQKAVAAKKNSLLMAMVDSEIEGVKKQAEELRKSGTKSGIFRLNIGSDAKAIKRAIDSIKKVAPELSFMCVSTETDKLTCFAVISEVKDADNRIRANEWVARAVEACGGRGGGRESQAQGSVGDASKIDVLLKAAETYVASCQ